MGEQPAWVGQVRRAALQALAGAAGPPPGQGAAARRAVLDRVNASTLQRFNASTLQRFNEVFEATSSST
jgi:hypothetical protein